MTFNSFLFNGSLFNGNFNLGGIPTSTEDISFNGYGLQNDQIITSNVDIEKIDRDFQTVDIPNDHGKIIRSDFWRLKRINIKGVLLGGSRSGLESLIFEFKKQLSYQGGNFDFKNDDGSFTRFFCTASNLAVDRSEHFMVSRANFDVTFDCLTPFGEATDYTANNYSVTELIFSEILVNDGNAVGKPVFSLVVSAATAITKINIKNNTTEEEIEITETIAAGQIIIFDSEAKEVTINGTEVDFDGEFLSLDVGGNSYTITATGTSIAYELTAKNKPKYL
jgi:hypothetical protein